MSYFPAFINLENKKILIVGGGNVAFEKLEKLLDFSTNISFIAQEYSDRLVSKIKENNLKYTKRSYIVGDISEYAIVIVAVDSLSLQEEIFNEAKKYGCLCNAVDSTAFCDFIFPAYIKKDDLTIAISTSGASPAFAKYFKEYLEKLIPSNIVEFLHEMKSLRFSIPKGKERMKMLDLKAKDYVSKL